MTITQRLLERFDREASKLEISRSELLRNILDLRYPKPGFASLTDEEIDQWDKGRKG